jgi:hypothetical protein
MSFTASIIEPRLNVMPYPLLTGQLLTCKENNAHYRILKSRGKPNHGESATIRVPLDVCSCAFSDAIIGTGNLPIFFLINVCSNLIFKMDLFWISDVYLYLQP